MFKLKGNFLINGNTKLWPELGLWSGVWIIELTLYILSITLFTVENIMIVIMITIMFDNIIFCAALIFIQKWWWLNIALFSRFFTYYTNFSLCKHAVSPYLYYKSRIIINNVITMSQPLSIIIHFLFLLAWSELLHDGNQTSTLHRASPTTEN